MTKNFLNSNSICYWVANFNSAIIGALRFNALFTSRNRSRPGRVVCRGSARPASAWRWRPASEAFWACVARVLSGLLALFAGAGNTCGSWPRSRGVNHRRGSSHPRWSREKKITVYVAWNSPFYKVIWRSAWLIQFSSMIASLLASFENNNVVIK